MDTKHLPYVYLLLVLQFVLIGYLWFRVSNTELVENPRDTRAKIQEAKPDRLPRVRIFELPQSPEFAGEKVPMEDPEVYERYERELYVNSYWESNTVLMMKRAGKFFPHIEQTLEENGIPEDFKYVALIESGLMNVTSPAGAKGFWQFMRGTAGDFGLEVSRDVDERYHFEKATLAACKYLRDSYGKFGNWTSVAASYNMGIAGITRRKNQQLSPDYYDLYLNEETSRYLFRALALKEIFENPGKYGFELQQDDLYKLPPLREIEVTESITNLAEWAKEQKSTYKEVKTYNPWLINRQLNVRRGRSYVIKLPV
ncbi:lytic transglycosylase domain-containing protein [Cyclobacterium jeungdonense]|uniref:Lytic transglycosylase domain-containing protein n=1 Tax=Cyclobacterium jeungdonense TaxID=708087 RepID=A0ABT8C3D6_9BACT|nr:lytic transglycosylase domain-containing protein [Cyclobacterium jeungdonense]MDN3687221.1 lytic transglycosylase domain-containing protein [Cyclobacterium jeungdonense]